MVQHVAPPIGNEPDQVTEARTPVRGRPVYGWALLGAAILLLQAYVFGSWLLSGDAKPVGTGTDPVPGYMQATVTAVQIVFPCVAAAVVWLWVVRPWRRDGRPSLDGLMVLGLLSMYWQDPIPNYAQFQFSYNAAFFNVGSWSSHIPGWVAPNGGRWAEPLLMIMPIYLLILLAVILACQVMRRARARWPHLGPIRLTLIAFVTVALVDVAFEIPMVALGAWTFSYAAPEFTLFAGHYYQFPLYEGFFVSVTGTGLVALRYFVNDRGESVVERGAGQLPVGVRQTVTRLLAVVAACNLLWFGCNLPYLLIGLHSQFNPDSAGRSYFTQGTCGSGTDYMCPGLGVPINRNGAAHVTPDGDLIGPDGAPTARAKATGN